MTAIALLALFLGILCGVFGENSVFVSWLSLNKDLVLYILMLSVGISIGMHRGFLGKIRK